MRFGLFITLAALRRDALDQPAAARIVDDSRQDGVAADVVGSEFAGEVVAETLDRPFAGDVRRAQGQAGARRGGRNIDDGAAARRSQQRHGALDAIEHGVDIDREGMAPFGIRNFLDGCAGIADAGIVDQHVEAAEMGLGVVEQLRHLIRLADIGEAAFKAGIGGEDAVERTLRQAADIDVGAGGEEALRRGTADAASAAGDDGPLAVQCFHSCHPLLKRQDQAPRGR